jgi:type I restriction enzyme, S subunit
MVRGIVMIYGLKPYPEMKDSGVDWLGKVPVNWEIKRAKCIFGCIDVRSISGEEELLTVSSNRGVVPRRSANVTMFKAESYIGHKLCWPNDLVINSLWAWAGGLGVSSYHGIISTAYSVYRPDKSVYPGFIHELVRSTPFHWELRVRSKGVWTSRLQLTDDSFLCAPLPLPPLPEQAAIVKYLDYVDRRVRRLIRAKRKLIALLTEQKQAIIHRAVTRGLDPDVPLKDSGAEWLGKVPEHWEVRPLKFLVPKVTVGIVVQPAQLYIPIGVPCLRSLNISNGTVNNNQLVYISTESNEKNRKSQIFAEDIVVVRTGQAGVAVIVTPVYDGANCIDLLIIRKSRKLVPEYLLIYLNSWSARTEVKYRSVGAIQAHYNTTTLANLTVPRPSIEEQRQILQYIRAALEPLDIAISRAAREINLLNEYRTRLIADVVTGKLDVRKAAATIPEVDPLAANGEPDGSIDNDSETDLDEFASIPQEDEA